MRDLGRYKGLLVAISILVVSLATIGVVAWTLNKTCSSGVEEISLADALSLDNVTSIVLLGPKSGEQVELSQDDMKSCSAFISDFKVSRAEDFDIDRWKQAGFSCNYLLNYDDGSKVALCFMDSGILVGDAIDASNFVQCDPKEALLYESDDGAQLTEFYYRLISSYFGYDLPYYDN